MAGSAALQRNDNETTNNHKIRPSNSYSLTTPQSVLVTTFEISRVVCAITGLRGAVRRPPAAWFSVDVGASKSLVSLALGLMVPGETVVLSMLVVGCVGAHCGWGVCVFLVLW